MPCRRFGSLLLFLWILLAAQLHADVTTPFASHLWIADGPNLWHHSTDAPTAVDLDSEQAIRGLAADPEHGRLFVITGDGVTAVTLDGSIDAQWALDAVLLDAPVLAQALPLDGSVWIASSTPAPAI